VEAIVSMYEDRFDLCNLKSQIVEVPRNSQTQNYSWWKRLTLQKSETVSSQMHQILISQFSMSVKRTKELRGLKGWYVPSLCPRSFGPFIHKHTVATISGKCTVAWNNLEIVTYQKKKNLEIVGDARN
jgi:hypothetical protein